MTATPRVGMTTRCVDSGPDSNPLVPNPGLHMQPTTSRNETWSNTCTVYQVRDIERSSPQGRGATCASVSIITRARRNKATWAFDAEDNLTEVELLRRQATFSYKDGEAFVFLDDETTPPTRSTRRSSLRRGLHPDVSAGQLRADHRRPSRGAAARRKHVPSSGRTPPELKAAPPTKRRSRQRSTRPRSWCRSTSPTGTRVLVHHHRRIRRPRRLISIRACARLDG